MNALRFHYPGETRGYAQSWAFSVLLHVLAVGTALLMISDLKLAPRPEAFKWDVALVKTTTSDQVDAPSPPVARPQPVAQAPAPRKSVEKPTPVQKAQPVQTMQQAIRQRDVRQVQPIERALTPTTTLSTQQPLQQPTELVTRETQSIDVPQKTVSVQNEVTPHTESQEIVRETAIATDPQQVTQKMISPTVETHPITERAISAVETPHVTQQTAPLISSRPVTEPFVQETAPVNTGESAVISKSAIESNVQSQSQAVVQEQAAAKEQPTVRESTVHSRPTTKADYSWLAEALWSKVERLKRYPAMARMNRWQGKVVLRAVIRDTGELVDLQVSESSGHAALDRDAMEVMRRASPITLQHSLGQSQVVLHIPISYSLK